jgi:tRNA pseudouridine38-40 synthase
LPSQKAKDVSRYFIYLSYNGTRYCGWQIQPDGVSVQQSIEEVLSIVLRRQINIVGAGRTDAGVHAHMMAAHFDVEEEISDTSLLVLKLNRMLSKDIAINKIIPVKDDAHARFDALSRTYNYIVTSVKNPFNYEWVCRMSLKNMSFEKMNEACGMLYGYTDFTSFSKLHTDVKTNNCKISEAYWKQKDDCRIFTITADRFLRNMVRAIVGTLFDVGNGKLTLQDFKQIIEDKNRCSAGASAPAEGLSLVNIEYPSSLFKNDKIICG